MAAAYTHRGQGNLVLTPKGWDAVRSRTIEPRSLDEFGPNPCPGTGRGCGVRTMNVLCHFCTRTIDKGGAHAG